LPCESTRDLSYILDSLGIYAFTTCKEITRFSSLFLPFVKRNVNRFRSHGVCTYQNVDLRSRRPHVLWHVAKPNVFAKGGSRRSRCHRPDWGTLKGNTIAVAGDSSLFHHETDESPRYTLCFHRKEGLSTYEFSLVELDDPSDASFEGIRRFVDVLSVKKQ